IFTRRVGQVAQSHPCHLLHRPWSRPCQDFFTVDLPDRYNVGADLIERNLPQRSAKIAIHTATADLSYSDLFNLTNGAARRLLHPDIPYTCVTYAEQVLGITDKDTTFSTTGLFHAYGFGNHLTFPYWVGASTVLHAGRHTPATVLDTIEKRKPTLFFSAPTLY